MVGSAKFTWETHDVRSDDGHRTYDTTETRHYLQVPEGRVPDLSLLIRRRELPSKPLIRHLSVDGGPTTTDDARIVTGRQSRPEPPPSSAP